MKAVFAPISSVTPPKMDKPLIPDIQEDSNSIFELDFKISAQCLVCMEHRILWDSCNTGLHSLLRMIIPYLQLT